MIELNRRGAIQLFRLGTELLGKLPRRGDRALDVAVKLLAILDAVEKIYGGKGTIYESIFTRYNLREKTSEPFVRLFFGTSLSSEFKLRRYGVSEHCVLIEAEYRGERIFFQEHRYGRPEISSEFFHTPGFDFAGVMATLWKAYPHGLYLSVKSGRNGWGNEVTFARMSPPPADLLSQKALLRITAGAEAWKARDGEPWCFIAYGRPGTGKTGYVRGMAAAVGGRLLKIDATSLPRLGLQEVSFLLEALAPRFLLVDDFEAAPVAEAQARLRDLFENLHSGPPGLTVAITVNNASQIDEALLRTERIDEAEEFVLPESEERTEVLQRLTDLHAPGKLDHKALFELVEATEGFNYADLGGLVRRFRRKSVQAALADVQKLRALAAESKKASEEKPPAGSPPPSVQRG